MLILPAYAKLNLSLSVVRRRDDGWHDIDSVLVPIDWHDLVTVDLRTAETARVSLMLSGPAAGGVPSGPDNLATRAGAALITLAGRPLEIDIRLCKLVPHAAGLGGGSADAAAVLRAGARLLAQLGITSLDASLEAAALEIGSDVPALLDGSARHVSGRGEQHRSLTLPQLHLAVASTAPSSTASTYAALRGAELVDDGRSSRLAAALDARHPADESLFGSALEPAAVRANPALATALERARGVIPGRRWHLTGSGGAVFTVAGGAGEAEEVAERMRRAGFTSRACRTVG